MIEMCLMKYSTVNSTGSYSRPMNTRITQVGTVAKSQFEKICEIVQEVFEKWKVFESKKNDIEWCHMPKYPVDGTPLTYSQQLE